MSNFAQGDAHVGVQAQAIHGDVYYQLPPDASAEQRFRTGVKYLDARMPDKARELIDGAVARGYDNDEVRFHQLLALLSGRTLRQLGNEDFDYLSAICGRILQLDGKGDWTLGLRTTLRLLNSLDPVETDPVLKELDELPHPQRDKVFDHLGALLEGRMEDQLWHRSVERARTGQLAGERRDRVWMFFHPDPAAPRVRPVQPVSIPIRQWLTALAGTAVFVVALSTIGWLLLRRGELFPVLGYLGVVVGVTAFVQGGAERHFRRERLWTKEAEFIPPRQRRGPATGDRFARDVTRLFDRYFNRYVPRDTDRAYWLDQTAGIRRHLRDELVEIYREQRVAADRVAWLVRYLVSDVKSRWEDDVLTIHRAELRIPILTTAYWVGGMVVVAAAGLWVAPAAVLTDPVIGTMAVLSALLSGVLAVRAWFRIGSEFRRVKADQTQRSSELTARRAAYERWQRKLSHRPSEPEMAAWLECDRKILVNETMRHYRLRPSQVIAHAFIEAPAQSYKRARNRGGPWRYSRYRLLLFLLTDDGVRQVDIDLDFEKCSSYRRQRLNYRFEAVAAVRVHGSAKQHQTFELTLVNGEPISVRVTEAHAEDPRQHAEEPTQDDNSEILSQVTLDASGLPRTLNVLEGIAAEGKEWIKHQRRRADEHLADLSATVRDLLD